MFSGRRQPSCDGTSRMTRECHVWFCERLGVKFRRALVLSGLLLGADAKGPSPGPVVRSFRVVVLVDFACLSAGVLNSLGVVGVAVFNDPLDVRIDVNDGLASLRLAGIVFSMVENSSGSACLRTNSCSAFSSCTSKCMVW